MGVPQTRHRVFFLAIRKDMNIDPYEIKMDFNYKPITYGEIKSGHGKKLRTTTKAYEMIVQATPEEKRVCDVYRKLGMKEKCFGHKIAWEENVLQTITANLDYTRGKELESISVDDIICAQTFPQDYDFIKREYNNVAYICGMSVPPIMIKRIVTNLIEQGIYDYKLRGIKNE